MSRPTKLLLEMMNFLLVPRTKEELKTFLAPLSERGVYRYLERLKDAGIKVFTPRQRKPTFRYSLLPLDQRVRKVYFSYNKHGELVKVFVISSDPQGEEEREPSEKLEEFEPQDVLLAFFRKG